MWKIDDEHIRPHDEPLENLPRVRRFQIDGQSALVAIIQMPRIVLVGDRLRWYFVRMPMWVAGSGRFDLDDVRSKIGQDGRSPWRRKKTGQVHHLQT